LDWHWINICRQDTPANWKDRIIGRGLLIDVYRYCMQAGRSIDPLKAEKYTVDELKAALKAQRSKLKADSIVLVRTGWMQAYLDAPRILGASVQSCQPAVRICEKSHAAFIK